VKARQRFIKAPDQAASSTKTNWHAYLSTTEPAGAAGINARDRIGKGPWQNAKGVVVAKNVEDLHSDANNINKQTAVPRAAKRGILIVGVTKILPLFSCVDRTGLDGPRALAKGHHVVLCDQRGQGEWRRPWWPRRRGCPLLGARP
jgi:hypothetical protein